MSFRIAIPSSRKAAARFIGKVRRQLQVALADNPELKRSRIADVIGVHRSVITRQLNGKKDMSLARVAELAWAMGYEPSFELRKRDAIPGRNHTHPPAPAADIWVDNTSASGSVTRKVQPQVVESV